MLNDVQGSIGIGSNPAGTIQGTGISATRNLARAGDMAQSVEEGRIEEAAKMFESLLATVMVKELRKGLSEGFFGSEAGADVFEGWLDEHLGESLAATGALDVAGFIRVNLERKQAEAATQTSEAVHSTGGPS